MPFTHSFTHSFIHTFIHTHTHLHSLTHTLTDTCYCDYLIQVKEETYANVKAMTGKLDTQIVPVITGFIGRPGVPAMFNI